MSLTSYPELVFVLVLVLELFLYLYSYFYLIVLVPVHLLVSVLYCTTASVAVQMYRVQIYHRTYSGSHLRGSFACVLRCVPSGFRDLLTFPTTRSRPSTHNSLRLPRLVADSNA